MELLLVFMWHSDMVKEMEEVGLISGHEMSIWFIEQKFFAKGHIEGIIAGWSANLVIA